jgi:hypothetical protein
MDIANSIGYTTRNERGYEELSICRKLTLFEKLWWMIKNFSTDPPKEITEEYETFGDRWVVKGTLEKVSDCKQDELNATRFTMQIEANMLDSYRKKA